MESSSTQLNSSWKGREKRASEATPSKVRERAKARSRTKSPLTSAPEVIARRDTTCEGRKMERERKRTNREILQEDECRFVGSVCRYRSGARKRKTRRKSAQPSSVLGEARRGGLSLVSQKQYREVCYAQRSVGRETRGKEGVGGCAGDSSARQC